MSLAAILAHSRRWIPRHREQHVDAGAAMPTATTYGRATVSGNFAYMAGGIAAATTNAVFRYDFAANHGRQLAPMQTVKNECGADGIAIGPTLFRDGRIRNILYGSAAGTIGSDLDIATNIWNYGHPVLTKAAAPVRWPGRWKTDRSGWCR